MMVFPSRNLSTCLPVYLTPSLSLRLTELLWVSIGTKGEAEELGMRGFGAGWLWPFCVNCIFRCSCSWNCCAPFFISLTETTQWIRLDVPKDWWVEVGWGKGNRETSAAVEGAIHAQFSWSFQAQRRAIHQISLASAFIKKMCCSCFCLLPLLLTFAFDWKGATPICQEWTRPAPVCACLRHECL